MDRFRAEQENLEQLEHEVVFRTEILIYFAKVLKDTKGYLNYIVTSSSHVEDREKVQSIQKSLSDSLKATKLDLKALTTRFTEEKEDEPSPSCSKDFWKEQLKQDKIVTQKQTEIFSEQEDSPNNLLQELEQETETTDSLSEEISQDDHLHQELKLRINRNAALTDELENRRKDLENTRILKENLMEEDCLLTQQNKTLSDSLKAARKELQEAKAKLCEMQEESKNEKGDEEQNPAKTVEEQLKNKDATLEQMQQIMEEFLEQQKSHKLDFLCDLKPVNAVVAIFTDDEEEDEEEEEEEEEKKEEEEKPSTSKAAIEKQETQIQLKSILKHVESTEEKRRKKKKKKLKLPWRVRKVSLFYGHNMFYSCGPNEVLVVSGGCGRTPPLMIIGGGVFVFHCFQRIQRLKLNILTLNVKSEKVYTRHGVPISVTGIAQVKIQGQNKEMLRTACQMFLGKSEMEIAQIAQETMEGHQRAIISHLTVEEIFQDRQKFSEQVYKVASSDLVNMGMSIISYTLKDVQDDQKYLFSLGKARTAQVQRDARVGQAEHKRDSVIKEAHAMQQKVAAEYKNEIEMAKAQRDFELKKAVYDVEVNTKKAESEMAYQLQVAKTKQLIEEEKMQVQVVERSQQIMLQEQEIIRKEKELDAKSRSPRTQRNTSWRNWRSTTLKGQAEAFALEAKGRAEAEQMAKKAEAFKQYQEGAMVDLLLEKLPLMAEEISKPLSEAQKVTMVSSGGSEVGAAKLVTEVLEIMTTLPSAVQKLTGIDISQGRCTLVFVCCLTVDGNTDESAELKHASSVPLLSQDKSFQVYEVVK
ncbi:hypothetical protein WMY93_026650 [Mugilogobius chulae]|uniref:Flotillin n=1 Tax=Mugilogobius chulae TaxID=88201 RepID=A0AAW0N1K2_9GOBI